MGFKCGVVGLPNVGKSTLFNALTATMMAEAANYPFCTIEPNVGKVSVPDARLKVLSEIAGSAVIIPNQIEFVDIAGLVKGASKGEGLGNQFLGHIREVDAIVHVLRCFVDEDITHVEGSIDPLRDAEIIETELILADLENVEKRINNAEKKAKSGDKLAQELVSDLKAVYPLLAEGKPARLADLDSGKLKRLELITAKPMMFVCNVKENEAATGNEFSERVKQYATAQNIKTVVISSQIEAEIACLTTEEEKLEFLSGIGLNQTGLTQVIKVGYQILDLITFFTIGPKEAHAWTLLKGSTAKQAAGVIHTDFEKGFIRAETIGYDDYAHYKGEQGAKEVGKLRLEGKEYLVNDGDIFHFRFNV